MVSFRFVLAHALSPVVSFRFVFISKRSPLPCFVSFRIYKTLNFSCPCFGSFKKMVSTPTLIPRTLKLKTQISNSELGSSGGRCEHLLGRNHRVRQHKYETPPVSMDGRAINAQTTTNWLWECCRAIAWRGACLGQMARRPLGEGRALRNHHKSQDTPITN